MRPAYGAEEIGIFGHDATIVVDVANVMGARPDGWWRDRAAAALRLCREVMALAERDDSPAGAWVLVLEGQARAAAALLDDEALPAEDASPGADWVPESESEARQEP